MSNPQNDSGEAINHPLVSVVMVTRNVDRFLAEAIESILGQTFKDLESIVVDYGSTDRSMAIISEYAHDTRLKLHRIDACGLAEARNAACTIARGQYLAIMDADDVALPERLALQVAFMQENAEVGLLGGSVEWIDTTGRRLFVDTVPTTDREIRRELERRCPFWQPTVLVRRDAFILAGGYREAFAPAEDYDLWLRITEHFQCANLPQVVLRYRMHPHQVSLRKRSQQTMGVLAARAAAAVRKQGLPDPLSQAERITPEILTNLGISHHEQHEVLISDYAQWIRHMCLAGELSTALQSALEIVETDLSDIARWQVASLHLTIASILWKQGRFLRSAAAAMRAVIARPFVLGRPLKILFGNARQARLNHWARRAEQRAR